MRSSLHIASCLTRTLAMRASMARCTASLVTSSPGSPPCMHQGDKPAMQGTTAQHSGCSSALVAAAPATALTTLMRQSQQQQQQQQQHRARCGVIAAATFHRPSSLSSTASTATSALPQPALRPFTTTRAQGGGRDRTPWSPPPPARGPPKPAAAQQLPSASAQGPARWRKVYHIEAEGERNRCTTKADDGHIILSDLPLSMGGGQTQHRSRCCCCCLHWWAAKRRPRTSWVSHAGRKGFG